MQYTDCTDGLYNKEDDSFQKSTDSSFVFFPPVFFLDC